MPSATLKHKLIAFYRGKLFLLLETIKSLEFCILPKLSFYILRLYKNFDYYRKLQLFQTSRDVRSPDERVVSQLLLMVVTTPSPSVDNVLNDEFVDTPVDADVIEAVKENIQPLQKGRRATALSAIFSTPHAQRDTILSRKREWFRMQVTRALEDVGEDEGGADPLDVYSQFVAWTLESYPQGQSTESGLMELLEEATRQLKDQEKYKQDPRYLKLWILYAGYVEKPAIIYSYLLANEIGTNSAQLYEEYAYVLERDGR